MMMAVSVGAEGAMRRLERGILDFFGPESYVSQIANYLIKMIEGLGLQNIPYFGDLIAMVIKYLRETNKLDD